MGKYLVLYLLLSKIIYLAIKTKLNHSIKIASLSFLCFFRVAISLIYFSKDFSLDDYVKFKGNTFLP